MRENDIYENHRFYKEDLSSSESFFFFVLHLNPRIYLIGLKSASELESPQIYSKPTENMEICMNHQIILMFSLIVQ